MSRRDSTIAPPLYPFSLVRNDIYIIYYMSEKYFFLYSELLYKMGHFLVDTQYTLYTVVYTHNDDT